MQDLTRRPHKFIEVALGDMVVSERAQRALRPARVTEIFSKLDLDAFGELVLSERDGRFYVIDGQHRRAALLRFLGAGGEKSKVPCKVFYGMNEREEAHMFRQLNTVLRSTPYDLFKIGLTAGYEEETRIRAIVEAAGLHIARGNGPGAVSSVNALRRAYRLSAKSLIFALKLAVESYGDSGLEGHVIEGFAQLHNRYEKALDDEATIDALANARGGIRGLVNGASKRQLTTGNSLPICIAAEAVEIINRHRKGKKLPSWYASAA